VETGYIGGEIGAQGRKTNFCVEAAYNELRIGFAKIGRSVKIGIVKYLTYPQHPQGMEIERIVHRLHPEKTDYLKSIIKRIAHDLNVSASENIEAELCYIESEIRVNQDSFELWREKGHLLWKLGRYEESIKCYDIALKIKPDDYWVWVSKGNDFWKLRSSKDAIICFDKAIVINPEISVSYRFKGIVLESLKSYAEAIGCYKEVIRLEPDDSLVWFREGKCFLQLGKFGDSRRCLETAVNIDPVWRIEAEKLRKEITQKEISVSQGSKDGGAASLVQKPDLDGDRSLSGISRMAGIVVYDKKIDDNNYESNQVRSKYIHIKLFSSFHSPEENNKGQYACQNIKGQKVHYSAFVILDNRVAITRNTTVMLIPTRKVSQGILPEAPGTNTPTTKEPNNNFAPSRKKSETVSSSSLDNIQNYLNIFFKFVKQFNSNLTAI